jgi:hypothetical protein
MPSIGATDCSPWAQPKAGVARPQWTGVGGQRLADFPRAMPYDGPMEIVFPGCWVW